jgi:tetratricopeptide (TPR) repeat protein
LLDAVLADRQTLFGWLILLATVAALAQIYTIPRYLLLPLVFLWVNLGLVLFAHPALRRWGWGGALLVIGLNLANSRGQFFPPIATIDEFDQRTGALLERSREYLKDHRANRAAVKYLVDSAGSRPIIAPNPYVHFLSLPRLGYVEKPLAGYAANSFHTPTFLPLDQFRNRTDAGDPLVVWAANRFAPIVNCRLLRPDPAADDELLHYSKLDPVAETVPSLAIYEHRVTPPGRGAPRLTPAEQHAALVAWLFPADDIMTRLDQLIAEEQFAAAVELCRQSLATEPMRGDLRLRYALLLAKLDQQLSAIAELRRLLDDAPANIPARRALAELLIAQKLTPEGLEQLNEVVRRDPKLFDVWLQIAQINGSVANYAAAREALTRAIELQPGNATARLMLARTWRAEEDNAAALRSLADAVKQLPDNAPLWHELAQCQLAARDFRAARDAFRRAHELQPDSRELANSLAWHLATAPDVRFRDPAEAVRLAEMACADRATTAPGWLDTLAAAYAANDRFDEAVRTAEAALTAARAAKDDKLAAAVETRLKLYRDRKKYQAE